MRHCCLSRGVRIIYIRRLGAPGGVLIIYIRRAQIGSSSLDAVPVTGSLVFSAPVYCLAVYCAARFYLWLLFGGADCVWLAGCGLFFRRVRVDLSMVTDGAAVGDGRAGITFGVVRSLDAPEAVVDLQSEGVVDLGSIPDVISLAGRRLGAAECRVLQGRDVRSVRVLVPDPRGLEHNFHDLAIVDMGDLPESSVSLKQLSMLRHMVWLQQDLEVMRAEAKKRFRNARPGSCAYCGTWIRCDMYRHVARFHLAFTWHGCGSARCPGARCGRARHRIAWTMFEERMMFLGLLSRPVSNSLFPHGQFSVRFGRIR